MIAYETREAHFPQKIGGFIMDDQNQGSPSSENPATEKPPASIAASPPSIEFALPEKHAGDLIRRFLACNPWYLLSAALLLYSFYLISADHSFLATEVSQLS